MTGATDAELMAQIATGDSSAYERIYTLHVDRVIRTATARCADPHEVADVVAETFLSVWQRAGGYDPSKGTAAQWISGIAARSFLDLRRSERRRRAIRDRVSGRADISEADIDELVDQIDASRVADAADLAIGRLPTRQRVVFELVALDGLAVGAAAEALGMSASAVSMRLTRARRTLQVDLATFSPTPLGMSGSES